MSNFIVIRDVSNVVFLNCDTKIVEHFIEAPFIAGLWHNQMYAEKRDKDLIVYYGEKIGFDNHHLKEIIVRKLFKY